MDSNFQQLTELLNGEFPESTQTVFQIKPSLLVMNMNVDHTYIEQKHLQTKTRPKRNM